MRFKQKIINWSLGISLMLTCGCIKHEASSSLTIIIGWDGQTPFDHQINSYLSTDWEDDEITMFITDLQRIINFRSISGDSLKAEIFDCFVCNNTIGGSNGSYESYQKSVFLRPSHVGSTQLHLYNSKYDETMRIVILPEFYTFTEPSLDFDDTQDSVALKLSSMHFTEENGVYHITDPHNNYSLSMNYTTNGILDSYEVSLGNSVSSEEMTGYIAERYYKTSAYSNGKPVYIKAFNEQNPSISYASVIVVMDIEARTITYQNPQTYSK